MGPGLDSEIRPQRSTDASSAPAYPSHPACRLMPKGGGSVSESKRHHFHGNCKPLLAWKISNAETQFKQGCLLS